MLGYHTTFFYQIAIGDSLPFSPLLSLLSYLPSPLSPLLSSLWFSLLCFISSVSSPLLSLIPLQIKDVTSLSRRSFRFFRSINHVNRVYNAVNDLVDENKPTRLDDVLISSVSIFEDILLVSKLDFVLFYFVTFYIIDWYVSVDCFACVWCATSKLLLCHSFFIIPPPRYSISDMKIIYFSSPQK